MKDYMIWVFSQRRFHVILHAICCCAWKMLDKNLAVTINFFWYFPAMYAYKCVSMYAYKCVSILSPNINIDFLLFELMSCLLIDELSSLLSALSLVDALSAFLCNSVDCFRSVCVLFLFSFFTLYVSLFSDFSEDSVNLESAINWVWVDIGLEVLLCGVNHFALIADSIKNQ